MQRISSTPSEASIDSGYATGSAESRGGHLDGDIDGHSAMRPGSKKRGLQSAKRNAPTQNTKDEPRGTKRQRGDKHQLASPHAFDIGTNKVQQLPTNHMQNPANGVFPKHLRRELLHAA
jgi:hypothetical protein